MGKVTIIVESDKYSTKALEDWFNGYLGDFVDVTGASIAVVPSDDMPYEDGEGQIPEMLVLPFPPESLAKGKR